MARRCARRPGGQVRRSTPDADRQTSLSKWRNVGGQEAHPRYTTYVRIGSGNIWLKAPNVCVIASCNRHTERYQTQVNVGIQSADIQAYHHTRSAAPVTQNRQPGSSHRRNVSDQGWLHACSEGCLALPHGATPGHPSSYHTNKWTPRTSASAHAPVSCIRATASSSTSLR